MNLCAYACVHACVSVCLRWEIFIIHEKRGVLVLFNKEYNVIKLVTFFFLPCSNGINESTIDHEDTLFPFSALIRKLSSSRTFILSGEKLHSVLVMF